MRSKTAAARSCTRCGPSDRPQIAEWGAAEAGRPGGREAGAARAAARWSGAVEEESRAIGSRIAAR